MNQTPKTERMTTKMVQIKTTPPNGITGEREREREGAREIESPKHTPMTRHLCSQNKNQSEWLHVHALFNFSIENGPKSENKKLNKINKSEAEKFVRMIYGMAA